MKEIHGYIRISRKMFGGEDLFWAERRVFSRAEAWIDLIGMASWRDRTVMLKGIAVQLARGELIASERFLCERWDWSRGRVRRFLELLAELERISTRNDHAASHLAAILIISKYETYQSSRATDDTSDRTTDGPLTGPPTVPLTGPKRSTEKYRKERETGKAVEAGASRPAEAGAPPAALLVFPCLSGKRKGSTTWELTSDRLAEWEVAYPEMDILAEGRKALAWIQANSLKTHDGMPAFLVKWFNRGQDAGRFVRRGVEPSPLRGRTAGEREAYEDLAASQRVSPPEGRDVVERLKKLLKGRMEPHDFQTWIVPLLALRSEGVRLTLAAPNQRFVHVLQDGLAAHLEAARAEIGLESLIVTTALPEGGIE